jgi:predicted secreted Zn-dependent protease
MRLLRLVALACLLLTVACSLPAAHPATVRPPQSEALELIISGTETHGLVRIEERVWLRTYEVSGQDGLPGIRRQLDVLGPHSRDAGRRFDALSSWALDWSFNYNSTPAQCSLRNATIALEVVITLPGMSHLELLSAGEQQAWHTYLEQLRDHENGHLELYRAAVRELANDYATVTPQPDCRRLAEALGGMGSAAVEAVRLRDRLFDAETGHGAVFPEQ